MASNDFSTKCGICLSHFTKPKFLPCFHTFCLKCLESNVQITDSREHFPCPICRTLIIIPEGGAECFQTNFYIQTTDFVSSRSVCDVCDVHVPARWKCEQCEQNFCERCAEFHASESFTREHNLVSVKYVHDKQNVQDVVITCKEHMSEELTFICKECNEIICNICKETLHEGHSYNLLSTEAEIKRKKLNDTIETVKNNVNEFERDIDVVKRQAKSKHKFFNEQIDKLRSQKDTIISSINKKFKEKEDTIKQLNEDQLRLSNEMCEDERSKITTMKQSIDEATKFSEQEHNLTFIKTFDSVNETIREIDVPVSGQTTTVSGHSLMEIVEQSTVWLLKIKETIDETSKQ